MTLKRTNCCCLYRAKISLNVFKQQNVVFFVANLNKIDNSMLYNNAVINRIIIQDKNYR